MLFPWKTFHAKLFKKTNGTSETLILKSTYLTLFSETKNFCILNIDFSIQIHLKWKEIASGMNTKNLDLVICCFDIRKEIVHHVESDWFFDRSLKKCHLFVPLKADNEEKKEKKKPL